PRRVRPAVIRPMSSPRDYRDYTPIVGAQTDIAPLGRSGPKPEHEKTADEDSDPVDWNRIEADPDFAALRVAKRRFIIPATVFFLCYYMALPVMVGFWPAVMKEPVLGKVNWAYLFALSQFLMTWIVCWLYVRAAKNWDLMNEALLAKYNR
ncbi:MAG: hypothetical protein RIQ71_1696, partial [Verrucomicrobiota bacterium]